MPLIVCLCVRHRLYASNDKNLMNPVSDEAAVELSIGLQNLAVLISRLRSPLLCISQCVSVVVVVVAKRSRQPR